ncbi:MAG: outer membrane beta-barrel protein [Bacteroidia bacterium]
MKKSNTVKTIIALAISLLSINSFAQSLYVKLNAGYNWGIASNINGSNSSQTGTVTTNEKVNISFGKGVNICGAVGYMFNKNIGAELGINYLIGGTTENSIKSSSNSSLNNYSSTLLNFIPAIIITPGFEKINPYAKVGFSLGMATMTVKSENSSTFGSTTSTTNQTSLLNGGFAIGLISALGVTYEVNEKMCVFGELNISTLSYSPTKSEITEYKQDGIDRISTLKTRDKVMEYTDSYTTDNSVPTDNNVSRKSTPINIPFSSLGVNIGVKFSF